MPRHIVIVLLMLFGSASRADASFISINVGPPASTTISLPASITAGGTLSFDLLLKGALDLGQYRFVLNLSSTNALDVAGTDFNITAANRTSDPSYVFFGASTAYSASTAPAGSALKVAIGDRASHGFNPASGTDLIATLTIATSTNLTGNLKLYISSDVVNGPDLALLTFASGYATPIQFFGGVQENLASYDPTSEAHGTPISIRVEPATGTNPVPVPPSLVLALTGIVPVLGWGWRKRRANGMA